jgi:hypothetical protein
MTMYKQQQNGVKRLTDGAYIPDDMRNAQWRDYLKWLEKGNTPEPEFSVPERRDMQVQKIKQDASALIVSVMPMHKQCNALARGLELTYKAASGEKLTSDEVDEINTLKTLWEQINSVRAASNVAEQQAVTSDTPEAVRLGGV